MPNWCENYAVFEHKNEAILQQLVDAYNSGETMGTLHPCPEDLHNTVAGSLGAGTPEQAALEEKESANLERYGAKNWYDWCTTNWGTKWDFGRDVDNNGHKAKIRKRKNGTKYVELRFDTAWGPPVEFYAHIHDTLGFSVRAYYFEPGMGFIGTSRNGDQNSFDIKSYDDDWLEDNVSTKLCRVFNLYEIAAQMREDNEETECTET
jgi:hypothetical protein